MFTGNCSNRKVCSQAAYHCFSRSKVWITASLVVEVASLIIGILAITHVLPGIGAVRGAVLTGLASPFFLLTTVALVFYGCRAKKTGSQKYSIIPSDASVTWKEKLEVLRMKNQQIALPPPKIPPEECLYTLSLLAQAGTSKLFKNPIPYSEPKNKTLKKLLEQCQKKNDKELYLSIASTFLENLPSLTAYIRDQTQAVLLLEEPTKEMVLHFKLMNKQIRMILLFLMTYEPLKIKYLEKYTRYIEYSLGNRCFIRGENKEPCNYFKKLKDSSKMLKEVENFIFVFSIYRRHYLLRLRPEKIQKISNCKDADLNMLLSATWFHGTRAASSLMGTDFILMPSGWLNQLGIIPFFGETGLGCQSHGVNANCLSGTYLDNVSWAVNTYANGFNFDPYQEIKKIDDFIHSKIDIESHNFYKDTFVFYSETLPRVEMAIKRLAKWDPEIFNNKKQSILLQLEKLKAGIAKIKKKKPDEIFRWSDDYYSARYHSLCDSVKKIETFLSDPSPELTAEEKQSINENFPAVFGSMTLLSEHITPDDDTGEYLVRGTALVGKDLQLLCVQKGNLEIAKKWAKTVPDASIKIFSFDQLSEAQKYNRAISPYLADIFSMKKFKALCAST